jgi:hypothetical protein
MKTEELLSTLEKIEDFFYQKGQKQFSRAIREAITKITPELLPNESKDELPKAQIIDDLLEIDYLIKEAMSK